MKNYFYTGIVAFVFGLSLGVLLEKNQEPLRCQSEFKFTASELNCLTVDTDRLQKMEIAVRSHIDAVKLTDKSVTRVSVFYRNLQTKRWFGVNEQDLFTPGSLLKVPIAIAYHKYREIRPTVFNEHINLKEFTNGVSTNVGQRIQPLELLVSGKSYSVGDLLSRLLIYSDNDVIAPLTESLDPVFYEKVLKDFDIRLPTEINQDRDFLTVKTYGAIFRSLYNASYLNRVESEELLSQMNQSVFKNGLVAGVPKGVPVSHKFGERSYKGVSSVVELHDCGIIYHDEGHYILCVMTEGTDFEKQAKIIETISRLVYNSN